RLGRAGGRELGGELKRDKVTWTLSLETGEKIASGRLGSTRYRHVDEQRLKLEPVDIDGLETHSVVETVLVRQECPHCSLEVLAPLQLAFVAAAHLDELFRAETLTVVLVDHRVVSWAQQHEVLI